MLFYCKNGGKFKCSLLLNKFVLFTSDHVSSYIIDSKLQQYLEMSLQPVERATYANKYYKNRIESIYAQYVKFVK